MPDNIDKYVPEFDEAEMRSRLSGCTREELMDMLMRAYKEKRVLAKSFDEMEKKYGRIHLIP
jgi:hypothetical protein